MKITRFVGGMFFVLLISVDTVQPMMRRFVSVLTRAASEMPSKIFNKSNQLLYSQIRNFSDSSKFDMMLEEFMTEYDCSEKDARFEIDFHSKSFVQNVVEKWELQHRLVKRLSCSFEDARSLLDTDHSEEKAYLIELLAQNSRCTVRVIELVLEQEIKEWSRYKKYRYLNALNDEHQTLVFSAVQSNWTAALNFLLSMKADVNIPNAQGITPLHVAAAHGNFEYLQALIAAGANCNVLYYEEDGLLPITPLRLAVELNDVKCVTELVECGASPEFPIEAYKTFLIEIAKTHQNQRIIDLLEVYPLYNI